jgi:hypothetical protein
LMMELSGLMMELSGLIIVPAILILGCVGLCALQAGNWILSSPTNSELLLRAYLQGFCFERGCWAGEYVMVG